MSNLSTRETVVKILRRLKLDSKPASDDFDAIYVHALVHYGMFKPEPLLNLFRNEFIRDAFKQSFYRGDSSRLAKEVESLIQWNNENRKHDQLRFDANKELASFIVVFNQIVEDSRTVVEVKQDQKLDDIHKDLQAFFSSWKQTTETSSRRKLKLSEPTGVVKLADNFYVERKVDRELLDLVIQRGTIALIKGAFQTGKSSLLLRAAHYAQVNGAVVIFIDLTSGIGDHLTDLDTFLHYISISIAQRLQINVEKVDEFWANKNISSTQKLTHLLEEQFLNQTKQLLLIIDEGSLLLQTNFSTDFYSLLRWWYSEQAFNSVWQKVNIIIGISLAPYLLIDNAYISPFNVGHVFHLEGFSEKEVLDLNQRYGVPVLSPENTHQFMKLLGGQPYLVRKALYELLDSCEMKAIAF